MTKILVIDDDQDVAFSTMRLLRARGYEVAHAPDAIAAISVARAELPDLILLDLGLPAGSGEVVLQRLRGLSATSATPVIVVTGSAVSSQQRAVLDQHHAAAILQKPVDADSLCSVIEAALAGTI